MVGHRKSQISTHAGGVKRSLTRFEYLHVMIDDHSEGVAGPSKLCPESGRHCVAMLDLA
jgi:hypothetical protein